MSRSQFSRSAERDLSFLPSTHGRAFPGAALFFVPAEALDDQTSPEAICAGRRVRRAAVRRRRQGAAPAHRARLDAAAAKRRSRTGLPEDHQAQVRRPGAAHRSHRHQESRPGPGAGRQRQDLSRHRQGGGGPGGGQGRTHCPLAAGGGGGRIPRLSPRRAGRQARAPYLESPPRAAPSPTVCR